MNRFGFRRGAGDINIIGYRFYNDNLMSIETLEDAIDIVEQQEELTIVETVEPVSLDIDSTSIDFNTVPSGITVCKYKSIICEDY